ncbi:MAG: thermonuclease family protein, partial [Candidatus Peregrinibacteria bacterium]|nr:thermonuclease family protein [Candidatus Peregrinibacteria bacterium]
ANFVAENFPKNCEWDKFLRVVDGDTIVTEKYRVRAIGIDTPEIKHPTKPIQKGGIAASDFAKEFFSGSEKVCLLSSSIGDKIDKYDRKLAYIFTETGGDFNAEILREGLAKGYFYYDFDRKNEFRSIVRDMVKQK